jgi:hypothetical protein
MNFFGDNTLINNTYTQGTCILNGSFQVIQNTSGFNVYSVAGTPRQISVSGDQDIVLSLPQNIDASSNVVFGSVVSNNALSVGGNLNIAGGCTLHGSVNAPGVVRLGGNTVSVNGSVGGNVSTPGSLTSNGHIEIQGTYNSTLGNFSCPGTFQNGPTPVNIIGCRFSRGDIYDLTGGYFYYASSGAEPEIFGSTGNVPWSMEVQNRILCHAEIDMPSDERAKTDIRTIDSNTAIEKIKALRAVSYKWNDGRDDKSSKLGWIAQEVGKAGIGEAVTVGPFGSINGVQIPDYHLLDRQQLVPLLWSATRKIIEDQERLMSLLH